jgi:hypothetical protein
VISGKMGTTLHIFLVPDDDALHPLDRASYERLLRGEPDERLPEYAGKRVRCAVVVVETSGRKPIAVSRIVYSFLSLDSYGRIDVSEREKETKLAMDSIPPLHVDTPSPQVIDARHHFARRRYEQEYRWKPKPEIETAILNTVFGKKVPQ